MNLTTIPFSFSNSDPLVRPFCVCIRIITIAYEGASVSCSVWETKGARTPAKWRRGKVWPLAMNGSMTACSGKEGSRDPISFSLSLRVWL
ncbi:hypothetical protein glysoja_042311 [Glycine soja]|uniref:Uncharacterized protein n=1 Tax=Glycine soja TaxID=3848 RepID=A0A0B2SV06_GLYSO|nr:hypothetical protein glysoja_042311 [Glycine soja]